MRTLKKTLALVLVLAMMFSLCVTASADFTDADEINYVEAADVLAAIGVIEGMPDGSFDAAGTLTRAQAAVMITRLLGAEDYAIATKGEFADVAANHWAAGAISFCVDAGIVEGYGDGNFGPNDTLTGYQWAKMLLCALGYNAKAEGMTGAAWQIAVAKLAAENYLFLGNPKGDKTVAATREEAALYALNLLTAYTVSYSGGSSVTVGDIVFTSGGTKTQSATVQFMDKYVPELECAAVAAEDNYGLAATGWWINEDLAMTLGYNPAIDSYIGDYATEEVSATYGAGTKVVDIAKAFGVKNDASKKYTIENYTNGTPDSVQTGEVTGAAIYAMTNVVPGGVTVDVVVTATGVIRLIANVTYLGVIDASADVKDTNKDDVDDRYVMIDRYMGGAATSPAVSYKLTAKNCADFEEIYAAAAALKGAQELYYVIQPYGDATAEATPLMLIEEAEAVTGKLTSKTAATYTIGGKVYVLNATAAGLVINDYTKDNVYYLDNTGAIIYTTATPGAAAAYAFIEDIEVYAKGATSLDQKAGFYAQAKLVMPDGSVKVVDLDSVKYNGTTYTIAGLNGATKIDETLDATFDNALYLCVTYTVNEDGTYNIVVANDAEVSGSISAKPEFATGLTGYNNSTFVVRTGNGTTVPYAYKVYTGYAALPVDATNTMTALVTGNTVGNIFYLTATTAAAEGQAQYAYITSTDCSEEYVSATKMNYVFKAIVDGKETTVTTNSAAIVTEIKTDGIGMYEVKYTAGVLTDVAIKGGDTVSTVAKDGTIVLATGGKDAYNDSTVVYFIDMLTGTVAGGDITEIPASATVYAQYVKVGTTVTDTISVIYYAK